MQYKSSKSAMRSLIIGIVIAASLPPALAWRWEHKQPRPPAAAEAEYERNSFPRDAAPAENVEQGAVGFANCRHVFPERLQLQLARLGSGVELCSEGFAVLHSPTAKIPMASFERMSRSSLARAAGLPRMDVFYPDPRLPRGQRAELADYRGSHMDRGHLSAAAQAQTAGGMAQSFSLSNVAPMDPQVNRFDGAWAQVESATRKYARRARGNVFVVSGFVPEANPATIGRNKVVVPAKFFKLVYDEADDRAWAFVVNNQAGTRMAPPLSYSAFVEATGLDFAPALRAARH